MPLIDVQGISVQFVTRHPFSDRPTGRIPAVEGVSFQIWEGAAVGIVGESGSGKSTIARVVAGLQEPTSGRILLGGEPVEYSNPRALQRAAQMVFQDPTASLNPRLRVGFQVTEPLRGYLRLRSRRRRRAKAEELLSAVGLGPGEADRYPHQFSGGQRQRIALARALAVSPQLLVADEPVASLDVAAQAEITELLQTLHRQRKLALLLVSHDLSGVKALTERVLVIYMGRVMEEGPTDVVLGSPCHPYTKALLDAAPRLIRDRDRERIVLGGDPPSPYDPPAGCVFHTRCPLAFDRCAKEVPRPVSVAADHGAACFLLDESGRDS